MFKFIFLILISSIIYGANTVISPNMGLPVPVVGTDPGPDWANNINASLSIIDQHNHSVGQGVQVNPSGLNINSDLTFQNNNMTVARSVRFNPQVSPISGASDLGVIYESGVDLYYNDGSGNQIRLTQGGSPAGSAGTITGLPSGTASASYAAGTFTFQSATNTPAAMNFGPTTIGDQVSGSKGVTIFPNSGIASNYNLVLPAALPGSANYVTLDNSGNLSFNSSGFTGSGAVALAVAPAFTGVTTFTGAVPITLQNTSSSTEIDFIRNGTSSGGNAISSSGGLLTFYTGSNTVPTNNFAGSYDGNSKWTFGAGGGTQSHVVNGSIAPTLGVAYPSGTQNDYKEGTWTPTISGINNASSVTLISNSRYQRVGNTVICTLRTSVTKTSSTFNINYHLSLPIAPNNNFTGNDALGIGIADGTGGTAQINGDSGAKTVSVTLFPNATTTVSVVNTFSYIINN